MMPVSGVVGDISRETCKHVRAYEKPHWCILMGRIFLVPDDSMVREEVGKLLGDIREKKKLIASSTRCRCHLPWRGDRRADKCGQGRKGVTTCAGGRLRRNGGLSTGYGCARNAEEMKSTHLEEHSLIV
ncbi:hypothetical protein AVEN_103265-1 [Araneus ventricosus]|uniref:Uncharacterized protein n=1 Tax=Araneus ventricosus TaxID=182803 RepID=A0A4Y2KNQ3_ARAVE|nr:hypothetical protein AVEN_103265-1 [Araneus ventricosus]